MPFPHWIPASETAFGRRKIDSFGFLIVDGP
jgi:hypothetical protein